MKIFSFFDVNGHSRNKDSEGDGEIPQHKIFGASKASISI
jgi:hypothetical protein